jgi:chromate transporter
MVFGLSQIAATFALLSLTAIGGANATLPELHRKIVENLSLMDETTFVNLVAIAQLAPGPNVIVISMLGWYLAGAAGLVVATLAMVVPSSLIAVGAERIMNHYSASPRLLLLRQALAPIATGLMLASGWIMAEATGHGPVLVVITGGMAIFVLATRANPLWGMIVGALLAAAGARLGFPI